MRAIAQNTAQHLDPVLFAEEALDFTPDEWQRDVLRYEGKKIILNCCRQSGKSTVAAVKAVHRAMFFPGSLILLVSPSQRQSSELFKKVNELLGQLQETPKKTEDNRLSVSFQGGSRIVSLPSTESTVRGFSSPDLVIIDEASRVSDELYFSIRPMLAVGQGELIILSTPHGKRGFFHREWTDENENCKKVLITAKECPRISEEFLREESQILGEWWFQQEYFCEFKEGVDSLFTYEMVISAIDNEIEPWNV